MQTDCDTNRIFRCFCFVTAKEHSFTATLKANLRETQKDKISPEGITFILDMGSRDGAVVRALASLQCVPGSIPETRRHMWVEFVVACLLREVFLQVLRFSPPLKNQHFQNSGSILECTGISERLFVNSLVLRG